MGSNHRSISLCLLMELELLFLLRAVSSISDALPAILPSSCPVHLLTRHLHSSNYGRKRPLVNMQEDMCIFSQSTSMKRLLVFTSGPLAQTSQFLLKNNQTTLVFP